MKTLYFDLGMGAGGDMLNASLLPLLENQEDFWLKMRQFEKLGARIEFKQASSKGVWGHRFNVYVKEAMEESLDVDASGRPLRQAEDEHNHHHHEDHSHEHNHHHSDHLHAHDHHRHEDHAHGHYHDHHTHEGEGEINEHGHDHHHHSDHVHAHGHHHDHHAHSHDHEHGHSHVHRGLKDISEIIRQLDLPVKVKEDALFVYTLLAEAEANSHNMPVQEIHFHEVGTLDAIIDIVSFSLLIHLLKPDLIMASPPSTGSGFVRCAHGILPVPAPATSYLLRGIPSYSGSIRGELLTPTAAALLAYFVQDYGPKPLGVWRLEGVGLGDKEFPALNAVRVWLGELSKERDSVSLLAEKLDLQYEKLYLLEANLDDMNGEEIAFAAEKLRSTGALDVSLKQLIMKKGRPGILLSVLCRQAELEEILSSLFKHSSTLGVRMINCDRFSLARKINIDESPLGSMRRKIAKGAGLVREKIEYEDLSRLAEENDLSLEEIKKRLRKEKKNC